jgi:L-threonylcarbamoyladenylate synthase
VAKIIKVDPDKPDVCEAAQIVNDGGVIAFPTDTLYGLGAGIRHVKAVERIYEIKGRDFSKPILLLGADVESLLPFIIDVSKVAQRLMDSFWPGPITLVFKASKEVPHACLGGGQTIGVRITDSPIAGALLREVGGLLTATSANRSGEPEPISAELVAESIGDRIDLIVDGGPCEDRRPSTLVNVSGKTARILREGRISYETLKPFLS